jgi:hypothetical protein
MMSGISFNQASVVSHAVWKPELVEISGFWLALSRESGDHASLAGMTRK